MRYFTYIAGQSFKSDAEGRRFFYLGSPFSRPYLIEDAKTEARLFRKMTWHLRIFFSAIILVQPFIIRYYFERPWIFFAFLGAVVVVQWAALRVLFHRDLRVLRRAPTRLPLHAFYSSMAQKHSEGALLLGFMGSLVFVAGGIPMCFLGGGMFAIGLTSVVFFGACAVAWGYALRLKHSSQGSSPTS